MSEMAVGDGVSRQAASKLVEALVQRGYLSRRSDAGDRRRSVVALTDRGQAAAAAVGSAIDQVDGALIEAVGADALWHAREVLAVMAALGAAEEPAG